MSREIKFRAWDKEEKIMISADSLAFEEYAPISLLFADAKYHFEIMQYTGLYDKNGKEICEGDIIKISNYGFGLRTIYSQVQFNDGCFDVVVNRFRDYLKCYVVNHTAEVIGNIYENPELLESEVE